MAVVGQCLCIVPESQDSSLNQSLGIRKVYICIQTRNQADLSFNLRPLAFEQREGWVGRYKSALHQKEGRTGCNLYI